MNRSTLGWIIGAVVVLIIIIVAVPFITGEQRVTEEEFGIGGGPGLQNNTASDILQNPDQYMGQEVTVTSEIEETISDNAFSLDTRGIVGDELLVISRSNIPDMLTQEEWNIFADRVVRITGTVGEFDTQEVERQIGVDLDDALFNDWNGQPYIMASQIQVVE